MSDSVAVAVLFWVIVAGCFFHVMRVELKNWKKRRAAGTPEPATRQTQPLREGDRAECAEQSVRVKPFISLKVLSGIVAMYAVRQSPYACPADLAQVIGAFYCAAWNWLHPEIPDEFPCIICTREELGEMLDACLLAQPRVKQWNRRKNGREGNQFVSRYDGPRDPNDDFIDLDALKHNIIAEALAYEKRESAECGAMMERNRPKFLAMLRKKYRHD